jgi:hypothetical protein
VSYFTPQAPYWSQWVRLVVEVGNAPSWVPSGSLWGDAEWGVDVWGGLYDPLWYDVSEWTEALDTDTGRNGALDPGDVGRATLVLYDPAGDFGLAGDYLAIGALIRASATNVASGESTGLFFGAVVEATAAGDLDAPSVMLRCDDILGSALGDPDYAPLAASSTSGRIDQLLDRTSFPDTRRDIFPDGTGLAAVDKPGAFRLDHARAAIKAAGGTLWADGAGVIHSRTRDFVLPLDFEPAVRIGTTATDDVDPVALVLSEGREMVVNDVFHQTADRSLQVHLADPTSRARYRLRSEVVTDLLNTFYGDLYDVALRRLDIASWPIARVDNCQVVIFTAGAAKVAGLGVGSLALMTYTGSDPWQRLQLVGGLAHSITPDEWITTVRAYDALIALDPDAPAAWSLCRWGVATWEGPPAADLIGDFAWEYLYWVDGPAARDRLGTPLPPDLTWVNSWPSEVGDPTDAGNMIGWRPGSALSLYRRGPPNGVDMNLGQLVGAPLAPLARPYSLVWCGVLAVTGDPTPFEMILTAGALGDADVPGIVRFGASAFMARTWSANAVSPYPAADGVPVLVVAEFRADVVVCTVNGQTAIGMAITDDAPLTGATLGSSPTDPTVNPTMARTYLAGAIAGVLTEDQRADLLARMAAYGVVDETEGTPDYGQPIAPEL